MFLYVIQLYFKILLNFKEIYAAFKRPIVKLQSVSNFSNLHSLIIERLEISDTSLHGLTSLKRLDMINCTLANFENESFRHVPNLEYLTISNSASFLNINLNQLIELKWLRISHLEDYGFLENLEHFNKELTGLVITDEDEKGPEIYKKLKHSNVTTLEINIWFDIFNGECLSGLPNLRHISFCPRNRDRFVTRMIDLRSLTTLESIYFENFKFSRRCLNCVFEKLSKLER